ncbi:MAG: prepilin peptidase [Proteobacteria bacterium]|nr:MAG: prepilin peptidase [Pseudomonadota bacterium]
MSRIVCVSSCQSHICYELISYTHLHLSFHIIFHDRLCRPGSGTRLLRFGHALIFCSVLLICSVIDLEHQIIPDVLSLPLIALSPLAAWLHPELDLKSSFLGILLGGGVFYAIAWLYFLIRKKYGLGLGDVKLLAAIGGWLGYQSIVTTMLWSSVLGSIIGLGAIAATRGKDLQIALPYGPFLSIAAVSYLLFARELSAFLFPF